MKIFGLELRMPRLRQKAAVSALGVRDVFGWIRESFPGAWQKSVVVDPIGSVTSFGAVFACISRIATDIAKLELKLAVEDSESGICTPAPATSPFWQVLRKPNEHQTRIQFLTAWLVSKLLFGNTYALKRRDARGIVVALYLLDARRVTPLVTPEGDVYYSLSGDDLAKVGGGLVVPATEIIHDRGVTLWHPLVGVSPIYACGAAATQGIRIQANSATFFENMSRPSGMLTAPGTIDEATALRLKTEWEKNFGAANIGKLAVLGDGLKYEAMTIPAHDAQLVQQLGWTVEDVARCFGVPLYKINAGPVPTAGNVEALESQYYSGCLQILVESIELLLTEGLGLGSGATVGYEVELELEGLLRMDSATQVEMLAKAVGGAIMAPNEARAKRNLKPVEGGDSVYLQQQNYSLEALAKRDAQDDPFGTAKPKPAEPALPAPDTPAANDPQAQAAADEAANKAAQAQRTADAATAQVRELLDRLQVLERAAAPITTPAPIESTEPDFEALTAVIVRRMADEPALHG